MADDVAAASTGIPWSAIGSSLFTAAKAQIEQRASGFLDAHKEANAFLLDCTEKLAKAMFFYAIAVEVDKKADLQAQMDALHSAMKEEALSIMVDVEVNAKSTFLTVIETIFDVGVKIVPMLLKV